MITCPTCGREVPAEVAVEVAAGGETHRFCSSRCADVGRPEAGVVAGEPWRPRRILVAVDGSGPSLRAAERAAALAALSGGEVVLLHAIDLTWIGAVGEAAAGVGPLGVGLRAEEMERAMRAEAEAQLERARRACAAAGVPVSTRIEVARPVAAVVAAARDADLVVMGSRGRGAVSGAILGSVSQRTVAATRTPVLLVH